MTIWSKLVGKGVIYGLTTGCATVGMAYLISWVIKSESRLNGLIDCILGITCVCCFLGMFEAITSINPLQLLAGSGWTFFTDYRMGIRRVAAQFGQPIIYGLFLMLVSPLAIYRITCEENRKVIRRAKIIYVLMCINVVLTVSRAPIFAFLLLQLILWYQIKRSKFIFRAIWILVLGGLFLQFANLLGLGIADWIDKFSSMFLAIFGTSESSDVYSGVANRFEIFDWVSKTVGSDIWFGKGVDAMIFTYLLSGKKVLKFMSNIPFFPVDKNMVFSTLDDLTKCVNHFDNFDGSKMAKNEISYIGEESAFKYKECLEN